MTLADLDNLIKETCPIHGLNSNGIIHFKDEATPEQRAAAQEIVNQNLSQLEK